MLENVNKMVTGNGNGNVQISTSISTATFKGFASLGHLFNVLYHSSMTRNNLQAQYFKESYYNLRTFSNFEHIA